MGAGDRWGAGEGLVSLMVGEESCLGRQAECGTGETTACTSWPLLSAEGYCQECAFQEVVVGKGGRWSQ